MQVLTLVLVAAMAQHAGTQYAGVLSKPDSRKVVREAEKQLAAFIRSLPEPVFVAPKHDLDKPKSRYLEHRGSPLVGRICEFRCRWEFVTLATDMIAKEGDHSEFVPTDPVRDDHGVATTMRVLTASIPTSLIRLYSFKDMFPERAQYAPKTPRSTSRGRGRSSKSSEKNARQVQRRAKAEHARDMREHDDRVRKLRHQLRLQIMPRAKLPDADPPRSFNAIVKIKSVEFERTAKIPTMIIHASLIISADLGINP